MVSCFSSGLPASLPAEAGTAEPSRAAVAPSLKEPKPKSPKPGSPLVSGGGPAEVTLESGDGDKVFNLLWGDVNDTNVVDGDDFAAMFELGSRTVFDAGFNAQCDLNASGVIDGDDFAMAFENMNKDMFDYPSAISTAQFTE